MSKEALAPKIAESLRVFGYPKVTTEMINDCWDAYERGDTKMPHQVIGMFAEKQLDEIAEARPDIIKRGTQTS